MSRKLFYLSVLLLGVVCLAVIGPRLSKAQLPDVPPPPADPNAAYAAPATGQPADDPNIDVQTRGPVHEAYAAPVSGGQAVATIVVQRQPPAPVNEVPPDMKPDSDKAVWIPGYWAWDEERKDFLWVSGVWRAPPPGFRWMPGYWKDNEGQGYQWVTGYWMPAHLQEATFMPQPPQSMDSGPNAPQPSADHFWVPGHWQWYDGRGYLWQPGYWAVAQPDWIWVPATYYWCPSGWVYVPGYWDYPLARRGLVFSPVYFAGPVAYYRPAVCLDVGVLSFSLFCHPAYCHYYFGDYYDDHYVVIGIRPWFYFNGPRHGYDPIFGYYRWYHEVHMGERDWGNHLAGWHEYYRTHPDMRPPHSLAEQRAMMAHGLAGRPDARQLYMARDVHQAGAVGGARLRQVSPAEHAQLTQAARETTHFQQERQQLERNTAAGARGPSQPSRVSLASMPSFKSQNLPGASAANVRTATNAAAAGKMGGAAPGAARPGAQVARPGTQPARGSTNSRSKSDKDKPRN